MMPGNTKPDEVKNRIVLRNGYTSYRSLGAETVRNFVFGHNM
ncbi:Unknown protein sequence [Pseudomonas savastanoi pv. phaseolicola]|nr:Unknown protein sequence [Pseudomonas savastanoi pv. phaseolicola]KPB49298.1 Unknown protein sequence [Pseudomonas savastanoi pv. phaseolicola]KPB56254.1 Unknown protein sequence [Pseudomonas savastanoi pv. phaseolicola]KPB65118.1 Unknown protein sequence [Pseudomonas amygdali pv. mellea]